MHFNLAFVLGLQISGVISMPTSLQSRSDLSAISEGLRSRGQGQNIAGAGKAGTAASSSVVSAPATSTAAADEAAETGQAGEGEEAGEEEEAEEGGEEGEAGEGEDAEEGGEAGGEEAGEEGEAGEVEIEGVFGTATAVEGGDIKQDIVFTKSAIGAFEYEFQAATADTVTVTENKTPAAPPSGFVAIEPSSFQVALTSKGEGLTLSKIDYIFDGTNADLAAMDLTQAQVGKLCTETGTFVIDEALGEIEFEAEENEVTLDLNKAVTAEGEWGIFLPVAAAGDAAGTPSNETATATATVSEATPVATLISTESASATATVSEATPVATLISTESASATASAVSEDSKSATTPASASVTEVTVEDLRAAKKLAGLL